MDLANSLKNKKDAVKLTKISGENSLNDLIKKNIANEQ